MKNKIKNHHIFIFLLLVIVAVLFFLFPERFSSGVAYVKTDSVTNIVKEVAIPDPVPPLDKAAYDKKLNEIANNPPAPVVPVKYDPATGQPLPAAPVPAPKPTLWPVKTVYPNAGALLPFNRIVAFYGNLYSTKMGVLGQYPEAEMLTRLDVEVKKWQDADPNTPVIPALHYIAVVAQGSPGADGKYRARMPDSEIDKVLAIAAKRNALVFLDVQVGFSTIQDELPRLEKYLKLPNVHFAMDPEFSMKSGIRPGKVVGTYDAADINYAAEYLAKLVRDNNLPPKILIVHRYTEKMVTNYSLIKPLPEVQIVMDMDGWGGKAKKINTYQQFVAKQPVQFTGFKLFFKNDILTPGTVMMTPAEVLTLTPQPSYIQYQ